MAAPVVPSSPFDTTNAQVAVDNRIATANFAPQTKFDQWGVTGEIEVPLGDVADLIYIGSYREYDAVEAYDSDFSALDVFNVTDNQTSIETMTHELRVQGEAFDGALNWLVGGYYSKEDISQSVSFALGADFDRHSQGNIVGSGKRPR